MRSQMHHGCPKWAMNWGNSGSRHIRNQRTAGHWCSGVGRDARVHGKTVHHHKPLRGKDMNCRGFVVCLFLLPRMLKWGSPEWPLTLYVLFLEMDSLRRGRSGTILPPLDEDDDTQNEIHIEPCLRRLDISRDYNSTNFIVCHRDKSNFVSMPVLPFL